MGRSPLASSTALTSPRYEAALVREDHRLYPVAQVELRKDPIDVRTDRAGRQMQVLLDLGVGAAPADQREYLAFPRGERGEPPRRVGRRSRVPNEEGDELAGYAGRGHRLTGGDRPYSGQQVVGERVLEQEPAGTGPQGGVDVL